MRAALLVLLAFTLACGSSSTTPTGATIDDLREAAEDAPRDPDAWRELAAAELFMDGGEGDNARPAVDHALELAPNDERVLYLAGYERELHGDLDGALDRYLRALSAAAISNGPLAPFVAESALASIEDLDDDVPNYARRVREVLEPVVRDSTKLGISAHHTASEVLIDLAMRRDDPEAGGRIADAQGCIRTFRVAGPIGPHDLLGFDSPHPATARGPLEARYDLGPGRGERETRTIEGRGCAIHLGTGPVAGGGLTFAEAMVEVPAAADYYVRLETPNPVELFVDGTSIARLDARREVIPRVTFHPVHLDAGSHEITVELATRHPNPVLVVSLALPNGRLDTSTPFDPALPAGGGVFERHLRTMTSLARGDVVRAREELRDVKLRESTGARLLLAGGVAIVDPFAPQDKRRDEGRRLFRAALQRDAQVWSAAVQLAQLEADDGRTLQAISALRETASHFEAVLHIKLALSDLLVGRGFEAESDRVLAEAAQAVPDACRPVRAQMESALRRDRTIDAHALVDKLMQCDARSPARQQELVRERNWDGARAEVTRLLRLEPQENATGAVFAQLELDRGRGDDGAIDHDLESLRELMPRNDLVPHAQADRLAAEGHRDDAERLMRRAIDADPTAMASLHRVGRALGAPFEMDRYRLDGAEVLRTFEASGHTYSEPQVLVLDYTVVRVFPDGSSLELTHNIFRVQSQEAVDEHGEFSPPPGAEVLQLHTIKADGHRYIEPDAIAGKDTISLPNLAPGDYVEFEYVRSNIPQPTYPGGFLGDRFYFQSYEVPFDRSELTIVLPRAMEAVIEPRGDAPRLEDRVEGDVRVMHWGVRESRPLTPEPMSVSMREFVPSINVGVRATWPGFVEGLRDLLADRDVVDPNARRLVATILRGAGRAPALAKASRIYAWVIANIEENGDVFGMAATMLSAREGSRARVLHYLLGIADLPSELVIARTANADVTEATIPDEETYSYLMVAVGEGDDRVFASTNDRGAPFGYVPAPVRGQPAIRVVSNRERLEGATFAAVPPVDLEQERRDIVLEMEIDDDGSAHVDVREAFYGTGAVSWRNDLEGVAEATLEEQFEAAYVARLAPGASMTSLSIEGRQERDGPLVLKYGFDVPALGRRSGATRLAVPMLYPTLLAPTLAGVATRRTTQLIPTPIVVDVETRVVGPGRAEPFSPVEIQGPSGASFRMTSEQREDALVTRRSVRIPPMRVEPGAYASFAAFCREVDEAEGRELHVPLAD